MQSFTYKVVNRTFTLMLLILTLIATVIFFRLSLTLYYDPNFSRTPMAIHPRASSSGSSAGLLISKLRANFLYNKSSKNNDENFKAIFLSDVTQYSDPKYNALKIYHNRTIELRERFNCRKLFAGDSVERGRVLHQQAQMSEESKTVVSNEKALDLVSDCEAFRTIRGYRNDPGTKEERDFPLAYVILVHKDFEHLERLLRLIYMPQHFICIHVDAKSPDSLKLAISQLARCFPNVILASRPQKVIYAHMSRLMADIGCMQDILKMDTTWKYLINYAATELPLKSNLETVQILQTFHGLNDIHEQYRRRVENRFNREYHVVDGEMKSTYRRRPPPPYNLTVLKGQAYNTYSREFLQWVFTDEKPQQFLIWSNNTYSPDEHYWATLNDLYHNSFLNSPGGFRGHPDKKGYLTRFISWQYSTAKFTCHGKVVHHICVLGSLDLPYIHNQVHLAVNKFDLTFDPVAYACIEDLVETRSRSPEPLNLARYKNVYFIRYKPEESS